MAQKSPRFSVRRAVAMYLGEDEADMEKDRRYQPSRTPCPVYTHNNDYLTASPSARKPRESADYHLGHWTWRRVACSHTDLYGWSIWRRVEGEEAA